MRQPVGGDDDLFLDAGCGLAVACGAVGLEGEDHAFLDRDRVVEGVDAGDHRCFVEADAEAVTELEAEARLLVGEAELLRGRPDTRDLVGRGAGADELDRVVEPLAALRVRVDLRLRDTTDVEGAVVARPVAHERVDDVEERLVAGPQQPVGEHVRMRVAAVARDGVDRLDLLGAELEQHLHRHCHDLVLAHARAKHPVDLLVDRVDDRSRVLEQRDLVRRLDRAGTHHHGLSVGRLDPLALQRVEGLHVGQVDPQRLPGKSAIGELPVDAGRERDPGPRSRRASRRASR